MTSSGDKKFLTSAFRTAIERDSVRALLTRGDIALEGMVPWSSNYTYLVRFKPGAKECGANLRAARDTHVGGGVRSSAAGARVVRNARAFFRGLREWVRCP